MASAALLRSLPRHAERVSASYFLHQIEIKTLKQVQGDAALDLYRAYNRNPIVSSSPAMMFRF